MTGNNYYRFNDGPMSARLANIKPVLGKRLVYTGMCNACVVVTKKTWHSTIVVNKMRT